MSVKVRCTDDGKYIVTITDGGTVAAHKCENIIEVGKLIDSMKNGGLEKLEDANAKT